MDVLLLGAAAVVLILLTIWIVWRPGPADATLRGEEDTRMMPQGDRFEDQYTSATADLSAGGVITTLTEERDEETSPPPRPEATTFQTRGEAWPQATFGPEGNHADIEGTRPRTPAPAPPVWSRRPPATVSMGMALLLALGSAILGAFVYSRWQSRRNTLLNRLRRRFG